jgi:hypothetical protein
LASKASTVFIESTGAVDALGAGGLDNSNVGPAADAAIETVTPDINTDSHAAGGRAGALKTWGSSGGKKAGRMEGQWWLRGVGQLRVANQALDEIQP